MRDAFASYPWAQRRNHPWLHPCIRKKSILKDARGGPAVAETTVGGGDWPLGLMWRPRRGRPGRRRGEGGESRVEGSGRRGEGGQGGGVQARELSGEGQHGGA